VSPAPLGTYSFLPWLRQGIAGEVTAAAVGARAPVTVQLQLSGEPVGGGTALTRDVSRPIELFGPGDVVGIDTRAIVRTEPRNWITNFEPNSLVAVEFYDEDFPWRYTPAPPDASGLMLTPWIALAVLAEGEFEEGANAASRPLPFLTVADAAAFPPAAELWAWAHVHVNRSLAGSDAEFATTDMNAVLPRLQAVLDENPDLAYSRIVCPRRLAPSTAYHAFVVPAFETGRLAGLGLDPADAPNATFSAWQPYPNRAEPGGMPYYHRWYFRTGTEGDFEYLVRLLEAKPAHPRVGSRDMDVRRPGSNLPGILDADLGGVLRLGGALRVPRASLSEDALEEAERYENWDSPYPHPFQRGLASFVNLPDDYSARTAAAANADSGLGPDIEDDPDPLITAPLYGRWHALARRLLSDRDGDPLSPDDNWVHDLNLDPRHRTAAGFGTQVVQTFQEDYMAAAWEQIGDVLRANQRIRGAQVAKQVSARWYERELLPLARAEPARALAITAPMQSRVLADGVTVRHARRESLVPPELTSAPMRRISRPGGRLVRSLPFDEERRPADLLDRVNAGEVSAAPPKTAPPGAPTVEQIADGLLPPGVPEWLVNALRRVPWLVYVPLVLALVIVLLLLLLLPLAAALLAGAVAAAAGVALYRLLARWAREIRRSDVLRDEGLTPEAVDQLPRSPDFQLAEPGSGFMPTLDGSDSADAARFKDALRDWHALHVASAESAALPEPRPLALATLGETVVAAVDPKLTIPRRTLDSIVLPPRIVDVLDEQFQEVMAYPSIELPMYKPLTDISAELFLPNLNLVEQNSITLLETNQEFIEAYMVGLNHEFARELLWREYVTDQRGSYFRQFWDVRSFLAGEAASDEELKERLRDIPPLHRWSRFSDLGEHDNRELSGEVEEEVVLVIRGELLKKYPTAVIYAQLARWQTGEDGEIDPAQERELEPLTAAEEDSPPREKVRTPLYEAKVAPDIYFFGFDLTAEEARGGSGEEPDDPPGWFFVVKERPGEPRFGFDVERTGPIQTFNDLAWEDAVPGGQPGEHVAASSLSAVTLQAPGAGDDEKVDQHADDVKVNAAPVSAARWGYLTYQVPVMVAIHAAEMLRRSDE
jgi:hypothetical protein